MDPIPTISNLPDQILVSIFEQLPVYDLLLSIPQICSRWNYLQSIACERRESLFLFDLRTSDMLASIYGQFGLVFGRQLNTIYIGESQITNSNFVPKLVETFPRVRNFAFSGSPILGGNACKTILTSIMNSPWAPQLRSLKILVYNPFWNAFTYPDIQAINTSIRFTAWNDIFISLNSGKFSQLKHLTLYDGTWNDCYPRNLTQIDLAQLTRLGELSIGFKCATLATNVFGSLNQIKSLNRFRILHPMSLEHFNLHHRVPLRELTGQISSQLTHLALLYQSDKQTTQIENLFHLLSREFPSLRNLHLDVSYLTLRRIIPFLRMLINLTHLRLSKCNTEEFFRLSDHNHHCYFNDLNEGDETLFRLESLRKLTLVPLDRRIGEALKFGSLSSSIEETFPNVRVIKFDCLEFDLKGSGQMVEYADFADLSVPIDNDNRNLVIRNSKSISKSLQNPDFTDRLVYLRLQFFDSEFKSTNLFEIISTRLKSLSTLRISCLIDYFDTFPPSYNLNPSLYHQMYSITTLHLDFTDKNTELVPTRLHVTKLSWICPNLITLKFDNLISPQSDYFHLNHEDLEWFQTLPSYFPSLGKVYLLKQCFDEPKVVPLDDDFTERASIEWVDRKRFRYQLVHLKCDSSSKSKSKSSIVEEEKEVDDDDELDGPCKWLTILQRTILSA